MIAAPACDDIIPQCAVLPGEDVGVADEGIAQGEPIDERKAEGRRHVDRRAGKRKMVRNQEKRAAAINPGLYCGDFFRLKRGRRWC